MLLTKTFLVYESVESPALETISFTNASSYWLESFSLDGSISGPRAERVVIHSQCGIEQRIYSTVLCHGKNSGVYDMHNKDEEYHMPRLKLPIDDIVGERASPRIAPNIIFTQTNFHSFPSRSYTIGGDF
jgi:hypothetical protein